MFSHTRKKFATQRFNFLIRRVLKTKRLECDPNSSVVIATQLCSRDILMYLMALKTFSRFVVPAKVFVIGDRLTDKDMRVLREHVDTIEIVSVDEVDTNSCPTGGCWERLFYILGLAKNTYVVQLDADTLTTSEPTEILESIKANTSFTLGTRLGNKIISLAEATENSKSQSSHVQVKAENIFSQLPNASTRNYVRGNAGFAGFARGKHSSEIAVQFSTDVENLLGRKKWSEWGSEQVTSNYVIANSERALILPFERYPYYHPSVDNDNAVFIHFIGSHRFVNDFYLKKAKAELNRLS